LSSVISAELILLNRFCWRWGGAFPGGRVRLLARVLFPAFFALSAALVSSFWGWRARLRSPVPRGGVFFRAGLVGAVRSVGPPVSPVGVRGFGSGPLVLILSLPRGSQAARCAVGLGASSRVGSRRKKKKLVFYFFIN